MNEAAFLANLAFAVVGSIGAMATAESALKGLARGASYALCAVLAVPPIFRLYLFALLA